MAHKHLGLTLDENLSFTDCINDKINKIFKSVDLLRKLSTALPRQSVLINYISIIRPHVDYGDVVIDDQPVIYDESVQYKAALAITGAIQGSPREELYQELSLEYLHQGRWSRRFVYYIWFFITKF